ncbi:MAG: VanW family protein [Candidatus Paceibacterota bacterium]|jgi:vancomycin resistance protein YoaR
MKNRKLLIGIIMGAVVVATISTSLAVYKYSMVGKFAAGTYVANENLSFLSFSEAEILLSQKRDEYLKTPIAVEILGKVKALKPEELGIKVSVEETLKTLKTIDLMDTRIWEVFGFGTGENKKLEILASIDSGKLFSTLEKEFMLSEISSKPANALINSNGDFVVTDGQAGTAIDKAALLKELKLSAKNLKSTEVKVATFNEQPLVTKDDLLAQKDKIVEELSQLTTLRDPIYSDDWQIRLKKHPDWVSFSVKSEVQIPFFNQRVSVDPLGQSAPKKISLQINQQKLNQFVDENISKWLDRPAKEVKIFTDKDGKVVIEGQGSDGKKVQREQLKRALELAVENKIESIPIPTISITPKINISDDLSAKGITERLAVGHTSYYGSPNNRVVNVKEGASKFNGVIVAPDEVFSFNTALGPVDGTTGFKKELVIKPEGTIPEFGGGICQVSTTMYRAALFAGLQISERNQHTYAVSYYSQILGHGLDATIYLGGPDLKFKNDTGHHVLIQTYTEGDYELYIVFYGTADGRRVEMEGPYLSNHVGPPPTQYIENPNMAPGTSKVLEHSHGGFAAIWYRHLFDKDGKENKEPIETHYKAMPEKIAVGAKP